MISDRFIVEFDKALRAVFAHARSQRPVPGKDLPEANLSDGEKQRVARLMRVNHSGEICAQALYQGQGLTATNPQVREALQKAADEETEHLAWTEQRLDQMGSHKSLLNPFFYAGAFSMGLLAGRLGDKWNLGFLAETERQVEAHLNGHLARLPVQDRRSRAILDQMKSDEMRHADTAHRFGAAELPVPIRIAMRLAAKGMTRTAYYI